MNATEELRAILDERGESYVENDFGITWRYYSDPHTATESMDGTLIVTGLTPEQAIAATLGDVDATAERQCDARTCHDANVGGYFVCSECEALVKLHSIGRSYVDEWGKRWYATSNEHGFNYCPNCGAKVVDE